MKKFQKPGRTSQSILFSLGLGTISERSRKTKQHIGMDGGNRGKGI
jgi:hypothetical protein